MSERLLKIVSVVSQDNSTFLNGVSKINELEIWTSRSKVINKNIQSIKEDIKFISIVDPLFTPIWTIIDKPYDVYSTNEETLESLQTLLNYSEFDGNTLRNAILAEISKEIYILFYVEKSEEQFITKCILLNLGLSKLDEILSKEVNHTNKAIFIDEISKKHDLIDSLMKQPSFNSNLNAKKQAELVMKQQQMKRVQLRQDFKMIITKELKRLMNDKPKVTQNEVAEICIKAMSYKFKALQELDDNQILEVQKWLTVFLSVLGVSPVK